MWSTSSEICGSSFSVNQQYSLWSKPEQLMLHMWKGWWTLFTRYYIYRFMWLITECDLNSCRKSHYTTLSTTGRWHAARVAMHSLNIILPPIVCAIMVSIYTVYPCIYVVSEFLTHDASFHCGNIAWLREAQKLFELRISVHNLRGINLIIHDTQWKYLGPKSAF